MGNSAQHEKDIAELLNANRMEALREYLTAHSKLPGPRGNLEMAGAFADYFRENGVTDNQWTFLLSLSAMDRAQAPTGNPEEMLPFCAALALGALYIEADTERKDVILSRLRAAMNDSRWRMREAAAMGFQRIAEKDFGAVHAVFDAWYPASGLLEKRGFVAALAHPPVLKYVENVRFCLKIGDSIMEEISHMDEAVRKSGEFAVLSKGMEYALSVFVAYLPDEGFAMLRRYAVVNQKDIRRIVRSNLGKARLSKKYTEQTKALTDMLYNPINK